MVTWHDAWARHDAHSEDEIAACHRPAVTHSVGFLVRSDRTGITLAACYDDHDGAPSYDRVLFIPSGMVVRVIGVLG
jgi:hypothetical protein